MMASLTVSASMKKVRIFESINFGGDSDECDECTQYLQSLLMDTSVELVPAVLQLFF